jgi:hypothetical protein
VDLQHSSEVPSKCVSTPAVALTRALRWLGGSALIFVLANLGGCVTVKPHEKELLSDASMVYGSGGEADLQETHVLANREGSAGAAEGSGGGCGCN